MMTPSRGQRLLGGKASSEGFSLLELLVAMAVFLLVSAVSFELFNRHQALLSEEQVNVGLNIGLRNALAQIQLDVVNAGNGLDLGINVPAWPVGVTIYNSNPTSAQCNPAASNPPVYVDACFDRLNVVVVDPNTPPIHPQDNSGNCISTSSGTTLYGQPPPPYTAAQIAGNFQANDQVLFVKSSTGAGKTFGTNVWDFTTTRLTAAGTPSASPSGFVFLSFNQTQPLGRNTTCPNPTAYPNTCNDPLGMTTNAPAVELTDLFCSADWVLRLVPISYWVNTSNPNDPQLTRTQLGTPIVVMDQVIGFKVGAALYNASTSTSVFQYNYNSWSYANGSTGDPNDFALIRSVRVSLIGRTQPDPSNPYRNLFDSGPYQIRGNSMIVNPRNLTMNND